VTKSLLWKLLGIQLLIIAFVIIIVWMAVNTLAANYFMTLMQKYNISPTESHRMFVNAVHRYLLWASLGAIALAVAFSFLLMKRVLGPLTRMTEITGKIASGDYSVRVPFTSTDEVGQLAASFNRMTESLNHIEQLRKGMMINVAHELRTPLTNIKGYLEALTDGVVSPSRETFELLQEETLRLVRLVEDILRLAKADAARSSLSKTGIRLSRLLTQAMEAFRPQFQARGIRVEARLPQENDQVLADPDQILQVVNNLFQNACQYTPSGGTFQVSWEHLTGEAKVCFSNSAGELDEKDFPFIFERFFRGEKSRSREHGGAGIGLAIVKELIEAHNGRVGADMSQDEIRIWFTLPT